MSEFLTPLTDHQIGPNLWKLDASLQYQSDLVNAIITVPSGFPTDYESCPGWLPIINSIFGHIADEPAVIHDWLYYSAIYDRETSDRVLLEAMNLIPGLSAWRKYGIYWGLRIGGMFAWDQHRKAGHNQNTLKIIPR